MSDACGSTPTISVAIRIWLKQYCRPIELHSPPAAFSDANDPDVSQTGVEDNCFPPAEDLPSQGSDEQAKRRVRISRHVDKSHWQRMAKAQGGAPFEPRRLISICGDRFSGSLKL
jgi:hypothetical protein